MTKEESADAARGNGEHKCRDVEAEDETAVFQFETEPSTA